jgi:hypothetical protein
MGSMQFKITDISKQLKALIENILFGKPNLSGKAKFLTLL